MKITYCTIVLIWCVLAFQSSFAQTDASERSSQRNALGVESKYYITRTIDGQTQRFFPVGAFVSKWPNSTPDFHSRFPSEKEWTSSREIFTLPWVRYHTSVPEWFSSKYPVLTGSSHFRWVLRTYPYLNESCRAAGLSGDACDHPLGPLDQQNISNLIQSNDQRIQNRINSALDDINEFAISAEDIDLMLFIQDEPEHGYINWFSHNTLTKYIHDNKPHNSISYIDLGPANGNLYLYDKYIYDDDISNYLSEYGSRYYHSLDTYEDNIKETVNYYNNSTDVFGINSYALTIPDPKKLGDFVTWIHEASGHKPVLPWISAEPSRYSHLTLEETEQTIKQQVYSAITHHAAGIMFYPVSDTPPDLWDLTLNISKELGIFKYYIENGELFDYNYDHNVHWKIVHIDNSYFLYAVNFSDDLQDLSIPIFSGLMLQSGETGVWYANENGSTILKLSAPNNLGFENDFSTNSDLFNNWRRSQNSGNSNIHINTIFENLKLGERSLEINDQSTTSRASVEQYFSIAPGGTYQIQAWYKGISGNQRLILQFYNDEQWLEEHQINGKPTKDWELIKTPAVRAPAQANRIKIHIGSYRENQSLGYWDDIKVNKSDFTETIR